MTEFAKPADPIEGLARRLLSAWAMLYPDPQTGRPGDPGALAALRRAPDPVAVLMEPAFHALLVRMKRDDEGWRPPGEARIRRLALVAAVLAQRRDPRRGWAPKQADGTRTTASPSFMRALGDSENSEDRRLSTLRFQALMATLDRNDAEEALTALRRVMPLVADVEFNLYAFVGDLMRWNDRTRIRWTFEYFGSAPPADEPAASAAAPQSLPVSEEIS